MAGMLSTIWTNLFDCRDYYCISEEKLWRRSTVSWVVWRWETAAREWASKCRRWAEKIEIIFLRIEETYNLTICVTQIISGLRRTIDRVSMWFNVPQGKAASLGGNQIYCFCGGDSQIKTYRWPINGISLLYSTRDSMNRNLHRSNFISSSNTRVNCWLVIQSHCRFFIQANLSKFSSVY